MQTPWLTAFLHDPHMIRPAAQLRMPRFHFGKDEKASFKETDSAGQLLRRAGPGASSRISRFPSRTPAYLAERNKAHPDYLGAGWTMMTNKASPCLQCHAIGQFKPSGGRGGGQRARPAGGCFAVPAGVSGSLDCESAADAAVHGHAAEHRAARGHSDSGAQDVREQADRHGAGDSRHAAQLRQCRGASACLSSAAPAPAGGSAAAGTPAKASGNAP